MASCHVSPAPLHNRAPSVPRVDPGRSKKKARQMGEVEAKAAEVVMAAAMGLSNREGVRGKTRSDFFRHPMGRKLTLEKNLENVMWNVISFTFFLFHSFSVTFLMLTFPNVP